MEIIVSSPGSPGTTFTDNVKNKILVMFDLLELNRDYNSLQDFKEELEKNGFNANYTRNILPFLQNCGIVTYHNLSKFENKKFFTNLGYAYVDILKCIQILKREPKSNDLEEIIKLFDAVQEEIYFECLIYMMKNKECNYSRDFFDVLSFVDKYQSIDSTEYLLILYYRTMAESDYLGKMMDVVKGYRNGSITIEAKTKTKNDDNGSAKSVNSFPYVNGNFQKAGVFVKKDDGRYYINEARRIEIDAAIREVAKVWLN